MVVEWASRTSLNSSPTTPERQSLFQLSCMQTKLEWMHFNVTVLSLGFSGWEY
jgi:hypothetical protein